MAQGYKWTLTIGAVSLDLKNVNFRQTSGEIDTSSKFYDGTATPNAGFTNTKGDLKTLFFSVDEIMESTTNVDTIGQLIAGTSYGTSYSATYDGIPLFSGTNFYVIENESSGSIPGEARVRISLKSDGPFAVATN